MRWPQHPCRTKRVRLAEHQLDSMPRRARPRRRCGSPAIPIAEALGTLPPTGVAPGGTAMERSRTASRFRALPWWKRRESNPRPSVSKTDALPIELLFRLQRPLIRSTHAVPWLALARQSGIQNRNRCAATGLLWIVPTGISKSFRRASDKKRSQQKTPVGSPPTGVWLSRSEGRLSQTFRACKLVRSASDLSLARRAALPTVVGR